MGTRTNQAIANPAYQRTLITIDISGNDLESAYLYELSDAGRPLDCFAQIGVMSGGTNLVNRVALLDQGYAGVGSGVSWSGHLRLGEQTFLYALLYAREASTYRLAAVTRNPKPKPASEGTGNA